MIFVVRSQTHFDSLIINHVFKTEHDLYLDCDIETKASIECRDLTGKYLKCLDLDAIHVNVSDLKVLNDVDAVSIISDVGINILGKLTYYMFCVANEEFVVNTIVSSVHRRDAHVFKKARKLCITNVSFDDDKVESCNG